MARTQSVTIMFCDLVASTERRARLGDDAYDEFSARLFVVLRRAVAEAGGREVSNAGDGMMIVFPESVADAVSCASEMHREAKQLVGDDMADLIRALHVGHVNLVSGYVSTLSALETIRDLPGVVRSLTLQEPVAPGDSSYTNPTKFLSDAFNNYVELCQNDAACRTSFPDLAPQYRRDFETYTRSPRTVDGDDGNGHHHAVWLDGARVAVALENALSNSDAYPLIATVVATPERSGVVDAAVAGQVVGFFQRDFEPDFAWGADLSNECSYERYTTDRTGSDVSRQAQPEFSGADDGFLRWACPAWPVHRIGSAAFDDPSTTVPTLIVTPTLLPGADPQWADIFRRGLPNSTVVTFATLDGNILGNNQPACLGSLRHAFLADPTKPLTGVADCERDSPHISFLASLGG